MRGLFGKLGGAFRRNVGAGLLVFIPLALSIWLVRVVWEWLDSPIRQIFKLPKPGDTGLIAAVARLVRGTFSDTLEFLDQPGVGLLVLFALIYLVGFLTRTFIGGKLVALGEAILRRVPLVRNIYTATKQILEAILSGSERHFNEVVLLEYPRRGIYAIGFVTSPARGEVQAHMSGETVNVFLPTTPNPTSGYLLVLPRSDLTVLDMSVEDAVKLIISGGIVAPAAKSSRVHVANPDVAVPPPAKDAPAERDTRPKDAGDAKAPGEAPRA